MRDRIPEATVSRLPVYLQAPVSFEEQGVETVSSDALAKASGVNSAKLRKDLSFLGSFGTRGVGYPVVELVDHIAGLLGLTDERGVVIVGVGNPGRALASYAGFLDRGFRIVSLVDADPGKVGTVVAGHEIEPLDVLGDIVADRRAAIAVLNFAPAYLDVPDTVTVRRVDLSTELQVLSFYDQVRGPDH